ncbi:MAG: HlyD family efflux transporter periplasmic adaptor subunit [Planctomycetota bacterium]|mgnify:CR=1 FL=1|nr:HlyD family efflux transporter periplasmic adaptor subunit [Planctomycetota bacterium]
MTNDVDLTGLAIDRGGRSQPGMKTRRHVLTRYVLPLILILGFLSLVAWASRDLMFPPREVMVVPVFSTTAEVRQQGTPLFKAAGWIEPRPTPIRVAALAPGVVEKLLVVEDQPVKAGDLIAELIKDDARLTFERATADFNLREAERDEARAQFKAAVTRLEQPVHLTAALRAADASLAKIQTTRKNLPFELRRAEADQLAAEKDYDGKLAAKGVVAGVEIDIARSKRDSATALVEELRGRDESLKKEQTALTGRQEAVRTQLELLADELEAKEQADAKVKAATARVEQARVALAEARLQVVRMTVVAPVDGRVFRLIAHPGARIGSGTTQMSGHDGSTVVTMYRPEMLQVRVDVRFEDIPRVSASVSLKQTVEINNPALSSPITGEVLYVSSEADIQKNTLQVKVAIPDPPPVFKPEMLVDVTFLAPAQSEDTARPSQELKIYAPHKLLQSDDAGAFFWVADQSAGAARKCRVSKETGPLLTSELVEITSGLTVATRLITTGLDGLREGDRILVVGEDPSFGKTTGSRSGSMNRLPSGGIQYGTD